MGQEVKIPLGTTARKAAERLADKKARSRAKAWTTRRKNERQQTIKRKLELDILHKQERMARTGK